MPWKEKDKGTMRKEAVLKVLTGQSTKAAVCREYSISRPTLDKWIQRYEQGQPMTDLSHAPKTIPHKTSPEMEALIVSMRTQYPAIGALKLRKMLENRGYKNLPCDKTINNILHRNGLITRQASLASTPYRRFERSAPNELWQADFKGHFGLLNGSRCHPLNITDDCSRFNLCSFAGENERFETIQPIFINVFKEYGMPDSFLCDNGPPWGTSQGAGYTRFEVWLMELGILTIHGRFLHPQTQGKAERFNGCLKQEYLKYHEFSDLAEAQKGLDEYRWFYNNERPHHALNLNTPIQQYSPSARCFPERVEPWEYDTEYTVCKVADSGYLSYNGRRYFLSEAFAGKDVGVRDSALPGQLTVVFRDFRIARIDPDKRVFTLRKISRLPSLTDSNV